MTISLEQAGRRFNFEWIFRGISHTFPQGSATAILGGNGSGKSTLLKILAGTLSLSEGKIHFMTENKPVEKEDIFRKLAIASPWLELPSSLTGKELIDFHRTMKPLTCDTVDFFELIQLSQAASKKISSYSSGMRQRLRLGLAILNDGPLLLLDEPFSNLDGAAMKWYQHMIVTHTLGKTIIISSNHQQGEYFNCTTEIDVRDFQPQRIL